MTGRCERTHDGLPVPGEWSLAWREMSSIMFENEAAGARVRVSWDVEAAEQSGEVDYTIEVTQSVSVTDDSPMDDPEALKDKLLSVMEGCEDPLLGESE